MSGEVERNLSEKPEDSIKQTGERTRSAEQSGTKSDRLRQGESTDVTMRKLKESSPSEKEAFYKKQKDSVERSKALLARNVEKETYNVNLRKRLVAGGKEFDQFQKEKQLAENAERKQVRMPDPGRLKG